MSGRKGTNPDPTADAVKPDPAPNPPRPEVACHKCGTILDDQKQAYWHARGDSAGCVRSLMGMVLNLNERLGVIEAAFEAATKKDGTTEVAP